MPCTREELEQRERDNLAPFAQLSADTRGRFHEEDAPEWRTHYQRDRDRVIHSRAFRRLEYKTQVFLNGTGDHLRTRLTHTIEVAAIARNIARALRLNEDLTETIALAHDLGHSPFGHKGEESLHRLMRGKGGFDHNRQSLRIVESLEQKYPGFPGLNLSWEVREGLIKHGKIFEILGSAPEFQHRSPSLEAQVANVADEITYYSHDIDDGLDSGLLTESALSKAVPIWRQASRQVVRDHGRLPDECRRYFVIRCLIDGQVKDVVNTTETRLSRLRIGSTRAVREHPRPLVSYSTTRKRQNQELRRYLYKNLYYNPRVHNPNIQAVRLLEELFAYFLKNPEAMGSQAKKRLNHDGLHRAVCDYLAGMTDRYAMLEHQRSLEPRT